MPARRTAAARPTKQFYYIAHTVGRWPTIFGSGKSPSSARMSAGHRAPSNSKLVVSLAAKALHDAFVKQGPMREFRVSPVNGRANIA